MQMSHSDAVADSLICSLLEDADLLSRVLGCLNGDGLHECRRVCKTWNSVCQEMRVHLSVADVDGLRRASESFPRAAEINYRLPDRSRETEVDYEATDMMNEDVGEYHILTNAALEGLAMFGSLRRLKLSLVGEQTTPEAWAQCFCRLSGLQEICLSFYSCRELLPNVQSCLNGLTALTGLESLEVLSASQTGATMPRMNGLSALRTLIVNVELLFDASGAYAFQDSTRLATLCAFRCREDERHYHLEYLLQVRGLSLYRHLYRNAFCL